jgi:hypothetical protein
MSITNRIDKITHIPENYLNETPPAPRAVKIEISGRCNYRCGFCALTVRKEQPKKDMDFELFKRITREMRDAGVEEIGVFFIGESFINPKLLVECIRYLKSDVQMPYVFLTSNASLATPDKVEACMAAGLDSLKWSINATNEEQFAEIMGVSPKLLNMARENVAKAWEVRNRGGYKTKLYASSIRYDGKQYDDVNAMIGTYILPYVDQHYWLPLYTMGSLAIPREHELGFVPSAGNIGRYDNPVDPLPCWSLFTEGHVLCDGRLSGCCFDATGHWIMGDLKTQSFMDAWTSKEFRDLRRAHLAKNVIGTACEKCALYTGGL